MISSNVFRCLRSRCLHQAATKADITSSNYPQAISEKQRQNTHLTQLIHANFPPSELCFAYGSGVFPQKNNKAAPDTMTDVIFVVRNSLDWHEKNLKQNPKHYALLMRFFGAGVISAIQERFGARCYFNPFVEINGRLLKYGVISQNHLLSDLENWESLYIAGRLHKPVAVLHQSPRFPSSFIQLNLRSALHTALLLLPERFDDLTLFSIISRISYAGDIRFLLKAENPDKIRNIVEPRIQEFKLLYADVITNSPYINRTDYGYCQIPKKAVRIEEFEKLMPTKLFYLPEGNLNPRTRKMGFDHNEDPKSQLYRKTSVGDTRFIEHVVISTVRKSSAVQTIKGFFTAGPIKSLRYSRNKLRKAKARSASDMTLGQRLQRIFFGAVLIDRHTIEYRGVIIKSKGVPSSDNRSRQGDESEYAAQALAKRTIKLLLFIFVTGNMLVFTHGYTNNDEYAVYFAETVKQFFDKKQEK